MFKSHTFLTVSLVAAVLSVPATAVAAPIVVGALYVTDDPALGGSVVVENLSAIPGLPSEFNGITLSLLAAGGATVDTFAYGTIGPLAPAFILNGAANPFFAFAALSFLPGINTVSLDVPDLSAYTSASLALLVDAVVVNGTAAVATEDGAFARIELASQAIPEPGLLGLLAAGVLATARRRLLKAATRRG
jgi:hypothetical protein